MVVIRSRLKGVNYNYTTTVGLGSLLIATLLGHLLLFGMPSLHHAGSRSVARRGPLHRVGLALPTAAGRTPCCGH